MNRELTKFELAAVKRIAANTKSLRTKVEKLNAKIVELENLRDTYLSEIKMWESPIVEKYGYTVDEILDGSYLLAESEVSPEVVVEDLETTINANGIEY